MAKQGTESTTEATPVLASTPGYEIVGLQTADRMPIMFAGREYDLANLSAEEAAYLMEFPDQVPYLKKLPAPAAA